MSSASRCCLCRGGNLSLLFKLDDLPISHFLRKTPDDPDPRFSVGFACCQDCGLLQIVDTIPADLIYAQADTYTTGFQQPRHLEDLITTTVSRQDPGRAIDIGCNDGSLLEALRRAGYKEIVGIEPNPLAAGMARQKGHEVYTSYLTKELAERIVAERGCFDTVYLRHVVEHVSDLEGFFSAVRRLLGDDGFLALELPDVEEGLALGSPAILWEEHVSYFTQALAEYMLKRFGFRIFDRRRYVFGGGSMAFVAQKNAMPAVCSIARPAPAPTIDLLHAFTARMQKQKDEMRDLISQAKSDGYQILIYGAAPRSCLMVSVCQIAGMIDFVVDDREAIHRRLMPGTPHVIGPLTDVTGRGGGKLLCLLGVGSENEFKVRAKIEKAIEADLVFVSLFPPRNTLDSIAAARRSVGSLPTRTRG
jgi:SAM-dependent methyltransferase